MTGPDGLSVSHLRIIDSPERIDIVLHRLRDAFTDVTVVDESPAHSLPGLIRVYVLLKF